MSSSKVYNVEVKLEDCDGNFEKMMRRFTKMVKGEGVIEEVIDRKFYKKPSKIRNEKNLYWKKRLRGQKRANSTKK